jgi:hypothetical protein
VVGLLLSAHGHTEALVGSALFIGILLVFAVGVRVVVLRRYARSPLRRCPLCRGDAVDSRVGGDVVGTVTCVELRCGQCGTWRRCFAANTELRRYERDLQHDRRAIEARLQRLQAADLDALGSALRREILGYHGSASATRRG